MGGLMRLCKLYGAIDVVGKDGIKVRWVWDYAREEAVIKSEMNKERFSASEKAKWTKLKK